jgi:hypothetical protein
LKLIIAIEWVVFVASGEIVLILFRVLKQSNVTLPQALMAA